MIAAAKKPRISSLSWVGRACPTDKLQLWAAALGGSRYIRRGAQTFLLHLIYLVFSGKLQLWAAASGGSHHDH